MVFEIYFRCGHCKSLEPEYAKAAKILKEDPIPIPLAKVDATIETDLAARFEVTGFPTLYIFRKGEKELYDGPRTALGKISCIMFFKILFSSWTLIILQIIL